MILNNARDMQECERRMISDDEHKNMKCVEAAIRGDLFSGPNVLIMQLIHNL